MLNDINKSIPKFHEKFISQIPKLKAPVCILFAKIKAHLGNIVFLWKDLIYHENPIALTYLIHT